VKGLVGRQHFARSRDIGWADLVRPDQPPHRPDVLYVSGKHEARLGCVVEDQLFLPPQWGQQLFTLRDNRSSPRPPRFAALQVSRMEHGGRTSRLASPSWGSPGLVSVSCGNSLGATCRSQVGGSYLQRKLWLFLDA
jgi:hypothetical protein